MEENRKCEGELMQRELHKGDTIKCKDEDDAIKHMNELEKLGYRTDFMYEVNGIRGIYLEIIQLPRKTNLQK